MATNISTIQAFKLKPGRPFFFAASLFVLNDYTCPGVTERLRKTRR